MRFLVVDDSATDRHLLSTLLEGLGHQVDASPSPEGTIDKIASGAYAAVFLDIVLPEQDGYKFLRTLRSTQETSRQYVVFYSGKKTAIEISYGLKRAGADAYLTKPVTKDALAQVLEEIQ